MIAAELQLKPSHVRNLQPVLKQLVAELEGTGLDFCNTPLTSSKYQKLICKNRSFFKLWYLK